HRDVAIKMLKGTFSNDEALRERFVTEARIAGRLDHPNILPIHDLRSLPDGKPYLVMKLVRGKTMADLLDGRTAADDAALLDYFERAFKALAYAHALGVNHRDLKPSNIMIETVVTPEEESHTDVFVMDWGLAKELPSAKSRHVAARHGARPNAESAVP